jgi:hypothetical protein
VTSAPADPRATETRGPAIGLGPILAALGGLAFVLSSWLNWLGSFEGSDAASAYDAPARFLVDVDSDLGGPSLGLLVLVVGIVVIVGAVVRGLGLLSLIGGVAALVIVVVFTFQLNRLVDDVNDAGIDVSLSDFLDFGEYVAAAGAVLAIVGGALSLRRT